MVKSNAERQKEYRQRAAEALRAVKALADNGGMLGETQLPVNMTPLPIMFYHRHYKSFPDMNMNLVWWRVASDTQRAINALLQNMTEPMTLAELDEWPGYVEFFGGEDYIQSVFDWNQSHGESKMHTQDYVDRFPPPRLRVE